jgi:hypothetical protein
MVGAVNMLFVPCDGLKKMISLTVFTVSQRQEAFKGIVNRVSYRGEGIVIRLSNGVSRLLRFLPAWLLFAFDNI